MAPPRGGHKGRTVRHPAAPALCASRGGQPFTLSPLLCAVCSILEVMKARWSPGEQVYVATDERIGGHFTRVRDDFRLVMLPDFAHLWAPGSRWWKRYRAETYRPGERAAEHFDETMQVRGRGSGEYSCSLVLVSEVP